MGNPYLNRDESILLTTQRIRINSMTADVLLTNQRLIIVDTGHAQFRPQTIPLTTIETVMTGEDAQDNPILSLSLSAITPQGATQSKELIFTQKASGERRQERDDWVKQLKEQITLIRQQTIITTYSSQRKETRIVSGEIKPDRIARFPVDSPFFGTSPPLQKPVTTPVLQESADETKVEFSSAEKGTPVTPEPGESLAQAAGEPVSAENGTPVIPEPGEPLAQSTDETAQNKIPLSSRFHPPAAASNKTITIAVMAIIILIVALVGGWIIFSANLQGAPSVPGITPAVTTTTALPVTTQVPTPTVQQTVTAQATPVPSSQPVFIIPATGVWVRVMYAGNYSGTVGTTGKMKQVTGSHEQLYQVPTINGTVEVLIQKLDGSVNMLTSEIYKDGQMVKNGSIITPRGTLDLRVDLKKV